MNTQTGQTENFIQDLIAHQARIRAFIRTLVPDAGSADDVLQEVNLVLWRKAGSFKPGSRFDAWACRTAYLQVLAHRQKHARQKLIFNDELLGNLAATAEKRLTQNDYRKEALRRCLQKLPTEQRELIQSRYAGGLSPQDIGQNLNRPVGSIRQTLYRIRGALMDCLKQTIPEMETRSR